MGTATADPVSQRTCVITLYLSFKNSHPLNLEWATRFRDPPALPSPTLGLKVHHCVWLFKNVGSGGSNFILMLPQQVLDPSLQLQASPFLMEEIYGVSENCKWVSKDGGRTFATARSAARLWPLPLHPLL